MLENQHFLLFPQCFLSNPQEILSFWSPLICCLQMLSIWTSLNFVVGKIAELKLYPFPQCQILDSCKLKEDNFKFDENSRKFSKRVYNTLGKRKLLVTSNFSFSDSVFKRLVLQTSKNHCLFGKGITINLQNSKLETLKSTV